MSGGAKTLLFTHRDYSTDAVLRLVVFQPYLEEEMTVALSHWWLFWPAPKANITFAISSELLLYIIPRCITESNVCA